VYEYKVLCITLTDEQKTTTASKASTVKTSEKDVTESKTAAAAAASKPREGTFCLIVMVYNKLCDMMHVLFRFIW